MTMPTGTREEALANPEQANAAINEILAGTNEAPQVPDVPDDLVKLPGGLVRGGKVYKTAVVRELDGSDEEALSRALRTGWSPGQPIPPRALIHFIDTLITRGTVSVGDLPATPDVLKSMLIGDRDELAVAVRCATYGDDMVIEQWTCPHCQKMTDISFSLKADVERTVLKDPASEVVFDITLKKGGKARVRLPNGEDQDALFVDESWTTAQRNTILISRCVLSYTDPAGQEFNMAAFPSMSLKLSIPDRQEIVRQVSERQPRPRYNEIKFEHECGNEVVLALGIRDLFRDLIAFLL